jgi:hypothetical protein
MSEQNRCNNWTHKISPEVPEEMLRMSIPVIAPALVWIRDTKDAIGVGDKLK